MDSQGLSCEIFLGIFMTKNVSDPVGKQQQQLQQQLLVFLTANNHRSKHRVSINRAPMVLKQVFFFSLVVLAFTDPDWLN